MDLHESFPGLEQPGPGGRPWLLADPAGGSQAAASVIEAMAEGLRAMNTNPTRPNALSSRTAELVRETRRAFAELVDGEENGIVFGPNSTTLNWHFARAVGRELSPGDSIVCTRLDHDCNVSPWLSVAAAAGAEVRFVPLDPATYEPDLAALERVVDESTRVVAFSRASNLLGTVLPPEPFVTAAKAVGAVTVADAVAAAPHMPLRQAELGIDVQFCSPYKFFGPHMGVLSARPEILERFTPDRLRPAPVLPPRSWELGMPSFEEIAGLRACIAYLNKVGFDRIAQQERQLTDRALQALAGIPGVRLHGRSTADGREPIFALTVDGMSPQEVAGRMADEGVLVSAGTNYAIEPLRALGLSDVEGVVRAGFVHYHTSDDVDRTFNTLARVVNR